MPKTPKFKAKPVFWDSYNRVVKDEHDIDMWRCQGKLNLPNHIWRFDSQHEFKVYLELVRIFGADRVIPQFSVEIIPSGKCYPKGKKWKVDFAIAKTEPCYYPDFYVEAKGAFLPEFATTLGVFETLYPKELQKLFIIFNGKPPTKNRVIKSLLKTDFKDHLLSLKELEQLTNLPCLS